MFIDKTTTQRKARPIWRTVLTTPARDRRVVVTTQLVEFVQGWALLAAQIEPNSEERVEIRARTRPFKAMQLIEINYGNRSWPVEDLDAHDLSQLRQLVADRQVRWCLHPMISASGVDLFEYDALILVSLPKTTAEMERAKSAYYGNLHAAFPSSGSFQ